MTNDSEVGRRPLTSYVSRADDEDEVRRLLGTGRLVTLTGAGGVGKTRLAAQVASSLTRAFPGGVAVAGLGELRDERLVARTVADALGLHDTAGHTDLEAVVSYLRTRRTLLLLDNCEHVLDGSADLVTALLRDCQDLVVLATSRCSLGLAGEHVLAIPPLAVPGEEVEAPGEALTFGAVRLFAERAAGVLPAFEVTESNVADVVRLCRRLDGLPLAIELAAARIRALSPSQIADRVEKNSEVLATGLRMPVERHRTLRATIEWSHSLCTETERIVWARCSVFAGQFDLSAVESVCAEDGGLDSLAVLDAVDGLVDKSVLARIDGTDRVHYRMLRLLREFGGHRLAESGDEFAVARKHRDHYARLIDQAGATWFGPGQEEVYERLTAAHADIREALSWSLRTPGEGAVALGMAIGVIEYWVARGAAWELRDWIDRALETMPPETRGRARGLAVGALCAALHADLPGARQRLATAEAIGDDEAAPYIAHACAFVRMLSAEPNTMVRAAEAVRLFGERGDARRQMHPMFIQGVALAYRGDLPGARELLGSMLRLCEEAGEYRYRSMALYGLGVVEVCFGGVLDDGERFIRSALEIDLRTSDMMSAAYRLDGLAWVSARREEWVHAAELFGTAATLWERCNAEPDVAVTATHRTFHEATRNALGAKRFDLAFADGRRRNPHDALAGPGALSAGEPADLPPLTPRESEIARLVAAGLSNRDIAARLVIARRTVETHLQHISHKLDFANRTQLAVWVEQAGRGPL
ncbi:ATP-binding protein [Amycolatopsis keratiniphila]|uniref:ATP-binding protein n=1 Tax=Amycolatopsis keratiniphila TaxID=129921 RepID=UPI00087DF06F|nr:LuxR C-terminal-related transcriptional regulator [Amycolatopsis keratiniphila]OLZ43778.1 LuxR family transcriptional regulator [Amycolatopsis keratiniphila subsp. nogabecina]SDU01970.1 Predicted ATPase [Amycolatopsis keratiniphila]